MPIVEQAKEHTKLYLCDGHGCSTKYPEICYKNGGECIHTPDPEHSIKKKFGDTFPETVWVDLSNGNLTVEEVDSIRVLQHFKHSDQSF